MMSTGKAGERVSKVLETLPATVRRGPVRWSVPGVGQRPLDLTLDGGWLSIRASRTPWRQLDSAEELWDALVTEDRARGPRRLALEEGTRTLDDCADLFIDGTEEWEGSKLDRRLRNMLADFGPEVSVVDETGSVLASTSDLTALCREAGVEFSERDETLVSITVRLRDVARRARVDKVPGGFRIWLDLGTLQKGVSSLSREAVALLLLTCSEMLRLVRPAVVETDARTSLLLEAVLPLDADASELTITLGALATAHRFCSGEVEALIDDQIADAYLAVRRWKRPQIS